MAQPPATELIDQFVKCRWRDAKEALRLLDPEYVERFENTVRLQRMELESPWTASPTDQPKQSLSKAWHRLLEGCQALVEQAMVLQTSADCLKRESFQSFSPMVAGSRAIYHWKSWFIHCVTLCDQTEVLVRQTLDVYCQDGKSKRELREKHKGLIRCRVRQYASEQRHSYVHPIRGSWSRGITEDHLWEGAVAVGIEPHHQLEQFRHPDSGRRAFQGEHNVFATFTDEILKRLGQILESLEEDLRESCIHGRRKGSQTRDERK